MLTAQQIAALWDAAVKIADPINEYLIRDIVRRIAQAGQLTSTAAYQIWRAQNLGASQREIKKELRRLLKLSHRDIRRVMYQSAQSGYELDVSRFPQVQAIPFEQNAPLQQIISAAVELAQKDFTNLTQTMGMVDPYGQAKPLQSAYRACTDFAFQQVITGAASYTEAIRQATGHLAAKGVRVIDYESGMHTSLEAAVRRIGTLNCGHAAFPIILGVNRPQYTPEELERLRADNEKGVTVDGVHYTGYEATQMQRKLERAIRAQKRRVMVDEAAGDEEKLAQDQTRLTVLRQRYQEFSDKAGLRTQEERTEVVGFGEKVKTALQMVKPLDKSVENVTISSERLSGVPVLRKVCDLNIEMYKCVTPDITTREVIITDERVQHIKDHHPDDFERYSGYLKEIIEQPDFIIEDPRPNTAMVLKLVEERGEHFRLVLRLVTPADNPNYKNSIITFMKIREREWMRLLRNKNILYKSE